MVIVLNWKRAQNTHFLAIMMRPCITQVTKNPILHLIHITDLNSDTTSK